MNFLPDLEVLIRGMADIFRGYLMLLTPSRIHPCVFDSLLWNYQVSLKERERKTYSIFRYIGYRIPQNICTSFWSYAEFLDKDNACQQPSACSWKEKLHEWNTHKNCQFINRWKRGFNIPFNTQKVSVFISTLQVSNHMLQIL